MAAVTVIPVIGMVVHSRLDSLRGCHALNERGVTKPFRSVDEVGQAITEALKEIALSEAASGRKHVSIDEMSYLVKFRLD
jgi:hypothetical protein